MDITASLLTFLSDKELLQFLQNHSADLLFLDIQLNTANGIAIAKQLNQSNPSLSIVYITGYTEYSNEICLSRFSSFLTKPIDELKLKFVLNQMLNEIETHTNYITLKIGTSPISLDTRKIIYIESDRRQIILHCTDTIIQYYYKISDIVDVLPDSFVQCHKSYIVNMEYVQSIQNNEILLKTQVKIPVSQKKVHQFKKDFMSYMGE